VDILFDRGLHLPSLDLWMDSLRARNGCWVSHAHTDHIAGHRDYLATAATADLMSLRYKRATGRPIGYGQPVEAEGYRLTLFPAGHCLGSSQMLVEVESTGERVVYTGDFKLRHNPTAAVAAIVPCDVLVMEATFGQPGYSFPDDRETLNRMREWIETCLNRSETPVVLAYSLGKAQEALWHLLEMGLPVRYDLSIGRVVGVYQRHGVTFDGDHGVYDPAVAPWPAGAVGLMPPHARRGETFRSLHRTRTAMLTGWAMEPDARWTYHTDATFPLSDHAGFPDLVRYAKESRARRVYTVNGAPHLAGHLRRMHIDARHLEATNPDAVQLSFTLEALQPA